MKVISFDQNKKRYVTTQGYEFQTKQEAQAFILGLKVAIRNIEITCDVMIENATLAIHNEQQGGE